ncbi:hypothetical protein EXIGLDRAFT_734211 [Exidia glandulosa HHB12029]|uniref:Uncharacterized protein n=1 Tax=Exidia glandulosa HHB12029 TaxID=1314781 RepID=A0A165K7M2_EXIGL|nr:hypothetical protein EXIGLDRAFT_734211 [Exidia glandulosa HHB12029]
MLTSFALNLFCLIVAFFYLLQSPSAGIWKLLVSQGVIYLVVILVAYLTPSILLILNLNDGVNYGMQPPSLIALVTCATRMYRSLVQFNTTAQTDDNFSMTTTNIGWHHTRSQVRSVVIPRGFVDPLVDRGLDRKESPDRPS